MDKPKVLNRRTMRPEDIPDSVYVGRPSEWGNPHAIGYCQRCRAVHNRLSAIQAFRAMVGHPTITARIRAKLRGKNLVCWCAPLPCHADVLLEIANGHEKL